MTQPLLQILKDIHWGLIALFWPIWAALTLATAVGAVCAVGHAASPTSQGAQGRPIDLSRRPSWTGGAVTAVTTLAVILLAYGVVTFMWEDFANRDESFFTVFTLKGNDVTVPIWLDAGRFWPLGYQEFNLIRHFTSSIVGYHVLPFAQLLFVACVLCILDDELPLAARAAITAFVLMLPSFVTIFTELVPPERNVIFWLVCLIICIKRFEQTQLVIWAAAAAVCAQFMLYYKETAFLLLLGFAVGRLILRCRRADGAGWDHNLFWCKESRLDLCLVGSVVAYFCYYVAVMFPHMNVHYAEKHRIPLLEVFLYYLKRDLLAWLFAVVALTRAYLIVRNKAKASPLWDGLALGGISYFASYLYLRLAQPYYLAPVDFIAALYIGRFAILSRGQMHVLLKTATIVVASAVLLQTVTYSAFLTYERKNVINAKMGIANVIVARYGNGATAVQKSFFRLQKDLKWANLPPTSTTEASP